MYSTCFSWAFVPRAFYVCTAVHVAAYCRSVGSASALACCYCIKVLLSPSNGARSPMQEVFLQAERQYRRKPRSLGEWDVLRNKWNYVWMVIYVQREKTKRVAFCCKFLKSREKWNQVWTKNALIISFSLVNKYLHFCKNHQILSVFAKIIK